MVPGVAAAPHSDEPLSRPDIGNRVHTDENRTSAEEERDYQAGPGFAVEVMVAVEVGAGAGVAAETGTDPIARTPKAWKTGQLGHLKGESDVPLMSGLAVVRAAPQWRPLRCRCHCRRCAPLRTSTGGDRHPCRCPCRRPCRCCPSRRWGVSTSASGLLCGLCWAF